MKKVYFIENPQKEFDGWAANKTCLWSEIVHKNEEETRLVVRLNDKPCSLKILENFVSKYKAVVAGKVYMKGEVKAVVIKLAPSLNFIFHQ